MENILSNSKSINSTINNDFTNYFIPVSYYEPSENGHERICKKRRDECIEYGIVPIANTICPNDKIIQLDCKLGFDKVNLHPNIKSVNKSILLSKLDSVGDSSDTFPHGAYKKIGASDAPLDIPVLPQEDNDIREFEIVLSPHIHFKAEKKNKKGKSKIYMVITVEPDEKHPVMRNLNNYSVSKLKIVTESIKEELRNNWGIDIKSFYFTNIELNTTFLLPFSFEHICNVMKFIFTDKIAIYEHKDIDFMIHEMKNINSSKAIKIYDKKYQLEQLTPGLCIHLPENVSLIRIELQIRYDAITYKYSKLTVESITDDIMLEMFNYYMKKKIERKIYSFFCQKRNTREELTSKINGIPHLHQRNIVADIIGLITTTKISNTQAPAIFGPDDLMRLIKRCDLSKKKRNELLKDIEETLLILPKYYANENNYTILFTIESILTEEIYRSNQFSIPYSTN